MNDSRNWLRQAAATWNDRADWWDEMSTANTSSADRKRELDRWQASMAIEPGTILLDAGCDTGQFAIAWAQRGCRVSGVDISSRMIERAKRNAANAGVQVELHLAPVSTLPFPDASHLPNRPPPRSGRFGGSEGVQAGSTARRQTLCQRSRCSLPHLCQCLEAASRSW